MLLCLDVGNSHIFGGVFRENDLVLRFRCASQHGMTSDEIGTRLKSILRENDLLPDSIAAIAISSVVPSLDYSMRNACAKYFDLRPFELHQSSSEMLRFADVSDRLGADRLATLIGAREAYPDCALLLIDLGTATTVCAVDECGSYLGGVIQSGMRLNIESLARQTAKLSSVSIVKCAHFFATTTEAQLQSGLYFGQLALIKEARLAMQEIIAGRTFMCIGTGGFSHLFREESVFDIIDPDLVLKGLRFASVNTV